MSSLQSESTLLTSHAALFGLLGLLLLAVTARRVYQNYTDALARLPGPGIAKWTSVKLKWALVRGRKMHYVHELHQRYGPVVRVAPKEVSLADATAVRAIYKTGSPYVKSEWYKDFVGDQTTFSLFSETDRKKHGDHRRIIASNFTERWVKNLEPFIASNVRLAIDRMDEEAKSKGFVDIYKWFTFMATDVIGDAAFGESFKLLETGKKSQYTADLESAGKRGVIQAEFTELVRLANWLSIDSTKQMRLRVRQYGEESIQRYWKEWTIDPDGVKPTLLTKEYAQVEAGIMSAAQIRRDAMGFIVAGTDTTAFTATNAVWLLTQNPSAQQALIEEVSGVPEKFSDEDLRDLPVLNGVIHETLRLRAPLSDGLPRVVPPSGSTFQGHFIPAGTTVGIPAWTMHRDPAVWQDPEEFRPLRWTEPTKDMKDCFLAFGGGSRVCIGQHFAQLELRHALTTFYRTFESGVKASFAEDFTEQDMEPRSFFLMTPSGGKCLVARK